MKSMRSIVLSCADRNIRVCCYQKLVVVSVPFGYIQQWRWRPLLLISSSHYCVAALRVRVRVRVTVTVTARG